MPYIIGGQEGKPRHVDREALTFALEDFGGATFSNAVVDVVNNDPNVDVVMQDSPLQITDVADLAIYQDEVLFRRLINNNVNGRFSNNKGATNPTINGNLQTATLFPFNVKNFSGGGLAQSKDTLYFLASLCGVYRVSFGLQFAGIGGVIAVDPYITLIKTTNSIVGNPYTSVLWRGNGNLGNFWASGSDLIELECGERFSLGINNSAVGGLGISTTTYTANAWIAINYTGNQH